MNKLFLSVSFFYVLAVHSFETIALTVSTTADSGLGSLRQAILDANTTPNSTITFSIASGHQVISPLSALPAISGAGTVIDATSQPGFVNTPLIEINGSQAGANVIGLTTLADNCTIKSVIINNFAGSGILISGSQNAIFGCFIGTDATGTLAQPNEGDGIDVFNVAASSLTGTIIGSQTNGQGNLVSGNAGIGINVFSSAPTSIDSTTIAGNVVGTDISGNSALSNGGDGIFVGGFSDISNTVIRGNLVSGNTTSGINLNIGAGTLDQTIIQGNLVGTNLGGTAAIGNGQDSVQLLAIQTGVIQNTFIGGSGAGQGNVISGTLNSFSGIGAVTQDPGSVIVNTTIQQNLIGTNAAGNAPLPNTFRGIFLINTAGSFSDTVIGGAGIAGNVISGNHNDGIALVNGVTKTVIRGNHIGTDITNKLILPNGVFGIVIPQGNGITGATDNTIGGTINAQANTISFNKAAGIFITGPLNVRNTIIRDSIFDNGQSGILLSNGGNAQLQAPTIKKVAQSPTALTVTFTTPSSPAGSFRVEFFNTLVNRPNITEGQTFLKALASVPSGTTRTITIPGNFTGSISATATQLNSQGAPGNTSEFSRGFSIKKQKLTVGLKQKSEPKPREAEVVTSIEGGVGSSFSLKWSDGKKQPHVGKTSTRLVKKGTNKLSVVATDLTTKARAEDSIKLKFKHRKKC